MKTITPQHQDGFVSIIVALIIIVFVTLMTLGFAFLARQNLYENQNRIFSTQAFYAAESAVNDTIQSFKNGSAAKQKTSCDPGPSNGLWAANDSIKYTCVLYETEPTSLVYPDLEPGTEQIVKVHSADDNNLHSITIGWEDKDGGSTFVPAGGGTDFLPQASYVNNDGYNLAMATGMLRVTLIPIYSNINRADLTTHTQTVFLYPRAGNGTTSQQFATSGTLTDPNQGLILDGNCNTGAKTSARPRFCNVQIRALSGVLAAGPPANTYYLRIRSLYKASAVTIVASTTGNTNTNTKLSGEQATIDATGKASNVVRRIQVRVPLNAAGQSQRPPYALESVDSVCKRLQVWQTGASIASVPSVNGSTTMPSACTGVASDL
jgi:hypothetical protein